MAEGKPIDWYALYGAGRDGRLMELLVKLSPERWAERCKDGTTILHYACMGPNMAAAAMLLQSGLVVDTRDLSGWTSAHWAATYTQPRVLEVLCAAGADLRVRTRDGNAPINYALGNANADGGETVRVLVANGVRLSTVRESCRKYITPKLVEFEHGVLRCRAAVVALLRVKKAGSLWRWDKFLLKEVAYAVWATRYDHFS